MNTIQAKIISIKRNKDIALIKLEVLDSNNIFSALILDFNTKDTSFINNEIYNVVFKESEVMLCHKDYALISARNKFNSIVIKIEEDDIFARIYFKFEKYTITSLITKEAKDSLNVKINEEFGWFVKSNEVMLSKL
ncbi:molybdopterin-binding protein [Helicobacter sp. MIT 14-3879]|uniref:TOBE domain-containing protein n=1 Tax=Helicobacter sp. MIT 14-3879 TaxID=2040649 RepID=UPI000E1E6287|nr:hypothetical protein [Helicobacter sp. MIT 14-3879]RDU63930.1 hypothetical protein CQA44_04640 [Helicobacter sp. MIT 14-3879]